MTSNNESKKNYIKNHTYYYFDNIIGVNDLDLDNILLNEISCGTLFVLRCCI